jgi:hypothetical protein
MTGPANAKQSRTLQRIFRQPTPNDIHWADIVSLFKHLGYTMYSRGGSKVCFRKHGSPSYYEHSPHPSKQTPATTIERTRHHLKKTGVTP